MKIKELQFSDLMLYTNGAAFLRYVKGHANPIIPVPEQFADDVQQLTMLLLAEKRHEYFLNYDSVPYRVARITTIDGDGFFLRRPSYPVPGFNTLGLKPAMMSTLLNLGQRSGMILFAGATGSGKTTTMYSLMTQLVTSHGNVVISIEDPPEIPVQGYYGENQKGLWYQMDAKDIGGYDVGMIAAMRYNPRFMLIGEIRAPLTAQEAIRAAVNGHLVLTTIHGSSLTNAILALQQIAAAATGSTDLARLILADGLSAVVHQSLITNPAFVGTRVLQAEMLAIGHDLGIRSKIRNGKLEHLASDIEQQRISIERGIPIT